MYMHNQVLIQLLTYEDEIGDQPPAIKDTVAATYPGIHNTYTSHPSTGSLFSGDVDMIDNMNES